MKISCWFTYNNLEELYFTGKTVVVIDVLRATTTIIAAFENGAKEIVPVNAIEFAMKATSGTFGGKTLLGGERNAKKIEGFNLGNSPLEYSADVVSGKSIVFFTTNGTKAIVKAKFADHLFVASFNNIAAVAKKLLELNLDFDIVCAGKNGGFSLEDAVCAGKLISEIMQKKDNVDLSDAALASVKLNDVFGIDFYKTLTECEHGKLLIENGFLDDLKYAANFNSSNLVPQFSGGSIKILEAQSS